VCRERGIPIMAYSPIEQGRMLGTKALAEVAARHRATPAQIALAWLLRQEGMIVIPKASQAEHLRDNRKALDLVLGDGDSRDPRSRLPAAPGRQRARDVVRRGFGYDARSHYEGGYHARLQPVFLTAILACRPGFTDGADRSPFATSEGHPHKWQRRQKAMVAFLK